MYRSNFSLLAGLLLLCASLAPLYVLSEVVQHSYLDSIYQYVEKYAGKQKLYIFFDIDDTILDVTAQCKKTVEPHTKQVIDDLKSRGISVYGLTARSVVHSAFTDTQLQRLAISMNQFERVPALSGTYDVGYSNGIFYCGRTPKGYILKQLFKHCAHDPSVAIIVIDDVQHASFEPAAQDLAIDCTFIHYTYAAEFIHPW